MHAFVAAGASFLVAVVWFDLMFDVQTRKHAGDVLPTEVLASIGAYYRRVTTEAKPMGRLVSLVMGLTLLSIIVEIARGADPRWVAWASLAAAAGAIGLAVARTFRNAVRLGRATDSAAIRSRLARAIYTDHLWCLAGMVLVVALQLAAAL